MKSNSKSTQRMEFFFTALLVLGAIFVSWSWFADPFSFQEAPPPPEQSSAQTESIAPSPAVPITTKPTAPAVPPGPSEPAPQPTSKTTSDSHDKNPLLSPEQEALAESMGVDPTSLPSELTPEQEQCMREKVGDERADAIEAGATPTMFEIIRARGCL